MSQEAIVIVRGQTIDLVIDYDAEDEAGVVTPEDITGATLTVDTEQDGEPARFDPPGLPENFPYTAGVSDGPAGKAFFRITAADCADMELRDYTVRVWRTDQSGFVPEPFSLILRIKP
jgi:hypothetical protein